MHKFRLYSVFKLNKAGFSRSFLPRLTNSAKINKTGFGYILLFKKQCFRRINLYETKLKIYRVNPQLF